MALVEPTKKGGRYTIKEREHRRVQVYQLYFEEKKHAAEIAKLLGVHRNTITDDISYWRSQIVSEINIQDFAAKMKIQIQKVEMQRDRFLELLEDADVDTKFKIEKSISDIDNALIQHYFKMIQSKKPTEPTIEIDESEIKELIRNLVMQENYKKTYSENELKFHFIHKTKCNMKHAERLLEKMIIEGLSLCRETEAKPDFFKSIAGDYSFTYNLVKFANMRGHITEDELSEILTKRVELEVEIEKIDKIEERLIQKYGEKSQWPEEILEKFEAEEFDDPDILE
ncbi:hypothetical protein [Nitrosopumilus sp.]|uniref:hypothetical protein n=1 Tax=Nitrosopumilus sp. TaxID=2024843 RepID=UPI003D0BB849